MFRGKLILAFLTHDPPKVSWDTDLTLGRCACVMNDYLQDVVPEKVINFVIGSLNRMNPIEIDMREEEADAKRDDANDSERSR